MDPDRHAEIEAADGRAPRPGLAKRGSHLDGRGYGLHRMLVTREQQEQRVAHELDQRAAWGIREVEHAPERTAHDIGELFGSDPSAAGDRSERFVKPAISTKHTVPSTSCQARPGASTSQSDANLVCDVVGRSDRDVLGWVSEAEDAPRSPA